MDKGFWETLSAIALAIVGVGALAVIVSKNANTTGVISASSQAFSSGLATALSPVTGSTYGSSGTGMSNFPIS